MPTKIKKNSTKRKVSAKIIKPVVSEISKINKDIDDGLAYGGAAVFFASIIFFLVAGFVGYNLFLLSL